MPFKRGVSAGSLRKTSDRNALCYFFERRVFYYSSDNPSDRNSLCSIVYILYHTFSILSRGQFQRISIRKQQKISTKSMTIRRIEPPPLFLVGVGFSSSIIDINPISKSSFFILILYHKT